jgi:hypothetical protein
LGKQRKVTRQRGETRFKFTGCRRQLSFRTYISDENALARHAHLIYKDTLGNLPDACDRADLEERYGKVLQTFLDSGPRTD